MQLQSWDAMQTYKDATEFAACKRQMPAPKEGAWEHWPMPMPWQDHYSKCRTCMNEHWHHKQDKVHAHAETDVRCTLTSRIQDDLPCNDEGRLASHKLHHLPCSSPATQMLQAHITYCFYYMICWLLPNEKEQNFAKAN